MQILSLHLSEFTQSELTHVTTIQSRKSITNTSEPPSRGLSNFQSQRPLRLLAPLIGSVCFSTSHFTAQEKQFI